MKKSPNRTAVFFTYPNGLRQAMNRPARRQQQSSARKWFKGETPGQAEVRRKFAQEWRGARRSREQGLMRS